MKIQRYKKAQKTINFYKNNFGFHDPYQVLIDATFCQLALQHKINIQEQLPKYLQSECRLVTTQCIIMEAESLGPQVIGATQIVKQFLVHKCGHDQKPISGAACMKSMTKNNHYIIATQDRDLQETFRAKAGQPIMYLHQRTPVLEQPSDASRKFSADRLDATTDLDVSRLISMKRAAGVPIEDAVTVVKKKFKKKQPNPLSCKRKKKSPKVTPSKIGSESAKHGVQDIVIQKKVRNKVKIAKHVKDQLKNISGK